MKRPKQYVYPAELCLRCGVARAIPQRTRANGAPLYEIAGVERAEIDPSIPPDLRARGWRWFGSFLVLGGVVLDAAGDDLESLWARARGQQSTALVGVRPGLHRRHGERRKHTIATHDTASPGELAQLTLL